jgi:CDP-glycerol glycerophosphotransferase
MRNKIKNLLLTFYARLTCSTPPSAACWVFSSVHNNAFNYNSSYLFLYVREHCPDIHPYYIINDDVVRRKLQKQYGDKYFIQTNTLEGIRKVLSCKVWFTSTAPPLYGTGFRKKYRIINLWHGVPLKKIGMEQENLSWMTRKYYKYLFADNYEAVLTTSTEMIPVMSRSFLVEKERIKIWGQPRNDMLFCRQDAGDIIKKIYGDENVPGFEKVVLYAPTFRDHEPTKLFPFPEFEMVGGAAGRLIEWLEEKQIFLCIRMHLYEQTGYEWLRKMDVPGSRIRFLNEDRQGDIMEILNIFDLLITDYSSIYIDYLLTKRPIVFLPYDREEYLKERGMNFDYDEVTPGPKPKTLQEFLNSIEELLYNHDNYVCQRARSDLFFNEIQEPCCEKICDYVKKLL